MAKLIFIDINFDETELNDYEILYVENFNELHQKIIMASRISILECINNSNKQYVVID